MNEQLPAASNIDERWLFQIELAAAAADGSAGVRRPRRRAARSGGAQRPGAARTSTCCTGRRSSSPSATASRSTPTVADGDPHRATSVRTAVIPRSEVAKVEAPGPDDPALGRRRAGAAGRGHVRHGGAVAGSTGRGAAARCARWPTPTTAGSIARSDADRRAVGERGRGRSRGARSRPGRSPAGCGSGIELLGVRSGGGRGVRVRQPHDVAAARPHARRPRRRRDDPKLSLRRRRGAGRRPSRTGRGGRSSSRSSCSTCRRSPTRPTPSASSTPAPPTCCSSRPAAARPRRTSA